MSETFDSINQWQRETFPDATPAGILNHYEAEAVELSDALDAELDSGPQDDGSLEEAADIILVLCDYHQRAGRGAQWHIDAKMARCRARKWNIQPDGTGQHQ